MKSTTTINLITMIIHTEEHRPYYTLYLCTTTQCISHLVTCVFINYTTHINNMVVWFYAGNLGMTGPWPNLSIVQSSKLK